MISVKAYQKPQKGDPIGLDFYKLSKFPQTGDNFPPLFDHDTKKYLTGLDETDPLILRITDRVEREKKQAEVIAKRKQLEALTGYNLDAKNYEFWDSYTIPLIVDINGHIREFKPETTPLDYLALIVLKRRGDIPFSQGEMNDPRFKDSKFYLSSDDEQVSFNKGKIRLERERSIKMAELFGSEESNYDRAWNIAYFLGLKPKKGCSFDKLEEDVELYTTEGNKKENALDKFLEATKMSVEDLLIANSFKRAKSYNIVKFNATDKLYYRGTINYRGTDWESIEYLKTPEMSGELHELLSLVKKKEQYRKNIA